MVMAAMGGVGVLVGRWVSSEVEVVERWSRVVAMSLFLVFRRPRALVCCCLSKVQRKRRERTTMAYVFAADWLQGGAQGVQTSTCFSQREAQQLGGRHVRAEHSVAPCRTLPGLAHNLQVTITISAPRPADHPNFHPPNVLITTMPTWLGFRRERLANRLGVVDSPRL